VLYSFAVFSVNTMAIFIFDQRAQVVDWVREGGGIMVDDAQSTVVDFIIESHGQNSMLRDSSHSTAVSTHWIRSCLEVHPYENGHFFTLLFISRSRQLMSYTCFKSLH
jgi:hypothetical protein